MVSSPPWCFMMSYSSGHTEHLPPGSGSGEWAQPLFPKSFHRAGGEGPEHRCLLPKCGVPVSGDLGQACCTYKSLKNATVREQTWVCKEMSESKKKKRKRKEKEASIYSSARHCHICYFIECTEIPWQVVIFIPPFSFFLDKEMEDQRG